MVARLAGPESLQGLAVTVHPRVGVVVVVVVVVVVEG